MDSDTMMYVNKKKIKPFTLMEFEEGESGDASPEALPNFQIEE